MKTIRIRNTRPCLVWLPYVEGFPRVALRPGISTMPVDHLNAVAEHKGFARMFDAGDFEVLDPGTKIAKAVPVSAPFLGKHVHQTPKAGKKVEAYKEERFVKPQDLAEDRGEDMPAEEVLSLADLTSAQAKELIAETFDRNALEHWLDTDTRSGIKTAIRKRLEEV